MRAALLVGLVALALAGCAAPRPVPARAMAPELLAELPPPVTVPGLQRDCLGAEGAARLHGGLATGSSGAAVGVATLAASGKLPESWTPSLLVVGAGLAAATGVFSFFHGEYQGVVRQCVDDAHKRALEDITTSLRGAR